MKNRKQTSKQKKTVSRDHINTIHTIPNKLCTPNLTAIISAATISIYSSFADAETSLSHGQLNNI